MILGFRKFLIGRWMLMAVLCFAFGPGIAVHAMADTYYLASFDHDGHDHHSHDHDGHAFANLYIDGSFDTDHACTHDEEPSLNHEHDPSHAAKGGVACLSAPQVFAGAARAFQVIQYELPKGHLPDGLAPPAAGEPPRSLSLI